MFTSYWFSLIKLLSSDDVDKDMNGHTQEKVEAGEMSLHHMRLFLFLFVILVSFGIVQKMRCIIYKNPNDARDVMDSM